MRKLKILWVEDDVNFGPSIHFRIEDNVRDLGLEFQEPELLQNGNFVWDTVRDLKPDIIMMDHNLEDVNTNGALLTTEIRFHNNETPIIYYSSEMGPKLMELVKGESNVFTSTRSDVSVELLRLLTNKFAITTK